MQGKTPQARPRRRPSGDTRRKPDAGSRQTDGRKPQSRKPPPPRKRGPVGDPRLVYRREPAAFGWRSDARATLGEAPACGIKTLCGACKYVNLDYKKSLQEKYEAGLKLLRDANLLGTAHILPAVESPRPLAYRAYFKLAVRPLPAADSPQPAPVAAPTEAASADAIVVDDAASGTGEAILPRRFAIGLFEPGTHSVVDMDDCPLHVGPLRRLLKDLRQELDASAITPYDEATGSGQLRYLAARAAHLTGEIMLTFVVRAPIKHELRALTLRLQRRGHKINATHMNVHDGIGNAIFGAVTERVAGAGGLRERLCDLDFEVSPTSFFQVNPWQAINLYRRVEMIAGPAQGDAPAAWDLYCGTGQISLILARQGYRVLGIEENPQAVADARTNARRNRLDDRAEFVAARVEDSEARIPTWAAQPGLIVVNPSRRGLAESTRSHLTWLLGRPEQRQARFVYVSCNVETLARDLATLTRSGFAVRQIEAFDMFAQTDGLEWLVVLTR